MLPTTIRINRNPFRHILEEICAPLFYVRNKHVHHICSKNLKQMQRNAIKHSTRFFYFGLLTGVYWGIFSGKCPSSSHYFFVAMRSVATGRDGRDRAVWRTDFSRHRLYVLKHWVKYIKVVYKVHKFRTHII